MGESRTIGVITFSLLIAVSAMSESGAFTPNAEELEKKAQQSLSEKLLRLNQNSELQIIQKGKGQTNRMDGNPFGANDAYHDLKVPICAKRIKIRGHDECEQWNDPWVSSHGIGTSSDASGLEKVVGQAWEKNAMNALDAANFKGEEYGIWQVTAKDKDQGFIERQITAKKGSFDINKVADMTLLAEVKQQVEQVGIDTAESIINATYDENTGTPPEETLMNTEMGRKIAKDLTIKMRNRAGQSLFAALAGQQGIEAEIGEMTPTCEAYIQAYAANTKNPQAEINSFDTLFLTNTDLGVQAQRLENCKKMMTTGYYEAAETVPLSQTAGTQQGDINQRFDIRALKEQLYVLDYAGQLPPDASFPEERYKQLVADYEVGGRTFEGRLVTNAEQINSYNRALKEAAQAWRNAATRSDFINEDVAEKIEGQTIPLGGLDVANLNGPTPSMLDDLEDTAINNTESFQISRKVTLEKEEPLQFTEKSASELIVKSAGQ